MRIASRIVGAMLALSGLGCLALAVFLAVSGFAPESVLVESHRSTTAWFGAALLLAVALGFLLGGWYFLRLDTNAPDDPAFLIAHRGKFKRMAQACLVVSLLWLGAAALGFDLARYWATGILFVACIVLAVVGNQIAEPETSSRLDWDSVPTLIRPLLKAGWKVGCAVFLILCLLLVRNRWLHHPTSPVVQAAFLPLLFGWEALVFSYGKLRRDRDTT
jgi:Na+/proline symporter